MRMAVSPDAAFLANFGGQGSLDRVPLAPGGFVATVASGNAITTVAVDAKAVYWADAGNLWTADLQGNNPTTLKGVTISSPGQMLVDNGTIFWSISGGLVQSVSTSGVGQKAVSSHTSSSARLGLTGTNVFFDGPIGGPLSLFRTPRAGINDVPIFSLGANVTDMASPPGSGLVVFGVQANPSSVRFYDEATKQVSLLVQGEKVITSNVVADGQYAYWATTDGGAGALIRRAPLAANASATTIATPSVGVPVLGINATQIVWVQDEGGGKQSLWTLAK
jgi:hypothetical protein